MQAVSDEQLIEWVANGDSSCLGTLFERHNTAVYQYCRQMTRQSAQAEDLVQEVFLKLLRKAGSYRREGWVVKVHSFPSVAPHRVSLKRWVMIIVLYVIIRVEWR
jgi:RNA polymerase sigma-70 factor (ECF subfamily)